MKFYNFMINIIIAVVIHYCIAKALHDGEKVYLSLPEHERADFLTFSLGDGYTKNASKIHRILDMKFPDALGIPKELLDKFQKLKVPDNFTTNLYVWVKHKFNMTETDLRQLVLFRSVCVDNGNCIGIGDIGQICCPF